MESNSSSMSGTLPLSPEQLAAEGASLRALACGLLRDPHAAEDVVQETWLAALVRGPSGASRFGAWLSTVARSFALKRLRGERRRQVHERAGARLEAVDEERGSEARARALRAVADALLELEEPYRTALMLRYFEGVAPRELARRLGVPEPTVKSRLARGLARLREELEARSAREGGTTWREALAVLAGLPAPAISPTPAAPVHAPVTPAASAALPAAAASAPALGAGLVLKLGGALAVATLGVLAWRSGAEPSRASLVRGPAGRPPALASFGATGTVAATRAPADGPQESAVAPPPAAGVRQALASAGDPPALPAPSEASFLYRISGQIFDADDLPLDGAEIFLGPRLHAMNVVAKTDDAGRFSVAFFGRRPTMDVFLAVEHGGSSLGLRELHLSSSAEFQLRAGLPTGNAVFEIALDGNAAEPSIGSGFVEEQMAFAVVPSFYAQGSFGGAPALQSSGEAGFLTWEMPSPCEAATLEAELSAAEFDFAETRKLIVGGVALRGVELQPEYGTLELDGVLVPSDSEIFDAAAPRVEITGFVLDAAGEPVPGAWVRCGAGESCTMVQAEPDGSFRLADLAPGELFLRAGGGDEGLATTSLALASGQHATWTARLDRGQEVAGRLVDPRGKGLARRLVEILGRSPTEAWSDFTFTDEEGCFAVPNCASLAYAVRVYPTETFEGFPATVIEGARPGALGDLVLDEDATTGAVELLALDAAGEPATELEARLRRADSGEARILELVKSEEGVRWRLEGLAPGAYELEAGTPAGWLDLGRVFVEPGATVELGQSFDRPGALELVVETTGDETPLTLAIWREHADLLSFCGTLHGTSTVALAPGDYRVLATTGPGGGTASVRVVAGMLEPLTVAIDGAGAIELRQGVSRPLLEPATEPALRATCGACHVPAQTLEHAASGAR